ncbi:unnamed protein product [Caenorhabditis angaria]|uniref:Uncharacterized protein n=1 Tax=Caenorhabditis angaria TaxID=860376 RepID=A0A9P1IKZ7_9PELO|nr:unnamed protein product [Caenorhabditis angaria]
MSQQYDEGVRRKLKLLVVSHLASKKSATSQEIRKLIIDMEGRDITPEEYKKAGYRGIIDICHDHDEIMQLGHDLFCLRSNDPAIRDITNLVNAQKQKKRKTKRSSSAMPSFRSHSVNAQRLRHSSLLRPTVRPPLHQPVHHPHPQKSLSRPKTALPVPPAWTPSPTPIPLQPAKSFAPAQKNITARLNTSLQSRPCENEVQPAKSFAPVQKNITDRLNTALQSRPCENEVTRVVFPAPEQKFAKLPTIKEFRDNVAKLFANGAELHMDELGAEYERAYGVAVDPYTAFSKKWSMVITGLLKDELIVGENHVVRSKKVQPPYFSLPTPTPSPRPAFGDPPTTSRTQPSRKVYIDLDSPIEERPSTSASTSQTIRKREFGTKPASKPVEVKAEIIPQRKPIGLAPSIRLCTKAFADLKTQEQENPVVRKPAESYGNNPFKSSSASNTRINEDGFFKIPEYTKTPKPKKSTGLKLPPAAVEKPPSAYYYADLPKKEHAIPRSFTATPSASFFRNHDNRSELHSSNSSLHRLLMQEADAAFVDVSDDF